jgi:hypothetical protein
MFFNPDAYGSEVAAILALDGAGERLMPLALGRCSSARALELLGSTSGPKLFPGGRAPEAALAGLYLYFSCLDEAHSIAQKLPTPEGSFWHAVMHRQEPDAGNASYWFNRVGRHAIFPELRRAAAALGLDFGERWDPFRFIEYCERARPKPRSEEERIALAVQRAEWQLLFDYCAAREPASVSA